MSIQMPRIAQRPDRSNYPSIFLAVFAVSVLLAASASAQPSLEFRRIVSNRPDVELYFALSCGGNRMFEADSQYYAVYENGMEIRDFSVACPDTSPCALSTSLVVDESGSMGIDRMAGARDGARTFVDRMDSLTDQAAILGFNNRVTLLQRMTSDRGLLHDAIDTLVAGGGTALWDAVHAGIVETAGNGTRPCRIAIVLTDGYDNSSVVTPADCIALANRNHVRVYTIALTTGADTTALAAVAAQTGGRFYATSDPAELPAMFAAIYDLARSGFDECVLTYRAACADGGRRTVELAVRNLPGCPGTASGTMSYTAPYDSTVTPPPPPTITDSAGVLVASDAAAWQWFLDGVRLTGETGRTLVPRGPGHYTVTVADANGCTATSIDYILAAIAAAAPETMRVDVYPDPSDGRFEVAVALDRPAAVRCTVYSTLGRAVATVRRDAATLRDRFRLDLRSAARGVYIVEIATPLGAARRTVVVR